MSASVDSLPYRPCVGVMLVNPAGLVFAGQRVDMQAEVWQMPQGGINEDETPRNAAIRELAEETGVKAADVLGESRRWYRYELPDDVRGRAWRGRYRGQEQKWFLMRFLGRDENIDLDGHKREFRAWRWIEPDELARQIVAFKRPVYEAVMDEFRPLMTGR